MKEKLKITCPCHFGLESVLKFEVTKIGGENITVKDGRVRILMVDLIYWQEQISVCLLPSES